MTETYKVRRLSKVAIELNVGLSTIIDLLAKNGYGDIDFNPNSRVGDEIYEFLLNNFNLEKQQTISQSEFKRDVQPKTLLPKGVTIPLELFRNIEIEDYIPKEIEPSLHVLGLIRYNQNVRGLTLNLSNCGLKEIPKEVFNLKHLEELILDNDILNTFNKIGENEITGIPKEISGLKSLKVLSLKNNKIKHLPTQIKDLPNLTTLNIDIETVITPPPEIVQRGTSSVRNYFHELKEIDFLYECKLIIVGEGRVGKTSLLKVLTDEKIDTEEQVEFIEGEKSTEGIAIKEWEISKDTLKIRKDFKFNVWDFGGQEIYHATHQFFLTKRSLYLFVTEATREDKYADFYYWLNVIKVLGNDSPVIIVLSKDDQRTKDLPISEYKKINPHIIEFEKVSCINNRRDTIKQLRAKIIKNINSLPHIGSPLPGKWVKIRNVLDELKQGGIDYISYEEYLDICFFNDMDEKSAEYLAEYFHDLGVFLHFDDPSLFNTVFLNHEWVTNCVYKVLDDPQIISNHGNYDYEKLKQIWSDEKYRYKINELFSLMKNEKFELSFELSKGRFLAPQLLPEEPNPAFEETSKIIQDTSSRKIKFEYNYEFMPKGILPRFIVKVNENIVDKNIIDKYCYRYGVIIEHDDSKAIIKELYARNIISVLIYGNSKRELLGIIRQNFKKINDDFHNLIIREMVPCNCELCQKNEDPYLFDYHNDIRYYKNTLNKGSIECRKSGLNVNIDSLINDVFVENEFNNIDKASKFEETNKQTIVININQNQQGDTFKGISGSTIYNHSLFEQSFNKVQNQHGSDVASALKEVKEIVAKSSNREAFELFDSFNEEIKKENPKKTLLKNIWEGLTKTIPLISGTANIAEKLAPLFT